MTASRNLVVTRNHIVVLVPSRNEQSFEQILPCWKTNMCPGSMSCQSCELQQSRSHQSPVGNREHACRCQAVTIVREEFSSQFPFSQRVRSMKGVYLAMLKAEKAGVFQTPQTLCEEDSLVADATVLRPPGILSLPGITLPVPVRARMSRTLNKFVYFGRTSTCPSSMSRQTCHLMGHDFNYPIHMDHQYPTESTHAGV